MNDKQIARGKFQHFSKWQIWQNSETQRRSRVPVGVHDSECGMFSNGQMAKVLNGFSSGDPCWIQY